MSATFRRLVVSPAAAPGIALGGLLLFAVACTGAPAEPADDPNNQRYELAGSVVAVDRELGTVTLAHEAVADFMEAMTMPFNVRDEWVFASAPPGARLEATLVVSGRDSWLEDIVVRTPAAAGAAAEAVIPAPDAGAEVPSIDLLDQSGRTLALAAYAGDYYAYTFIYTRCPLPDFCPLMSENFDTIFSAVEADPVRYGNLKLLSISIDHEYDTPEVLAEYAQRYLEEDVPEGFERWRFATSDAEGLHDLGEFSGLRFMPDRSEFVHSLRTVLVDPSGHVMRAFIGNAWKPDELLEALAVAAGSG